MPKSLWDDATISQAMFVKEGATITYNPDATIKIDMAAMEKNMAELLAPNPKKATPATPENIVAHYHGQTENLVFYPRTMGPEGYEECNQGPGPVSFQSIQTLLARFFIQSFIDFRIRNWRDFCIGITNYTYNPRDGRTMYMPMFDYDGKNIKKKIRADVKRLQEDFKLGDAWVYHTKRGFHVYFFTDVVDWPEFDSMLSHVNCCEGFKRSSRRNGFATLRVSAKYTKFDIGFEYVLKATKPERVKRVLQKGHVIQALLRLGEGCGTHFASLFPQWAHFGEDYREWRPSKPGRPNKRYGSKKRRLVKKARHHLDPDALRGLSKAEAHKVVEIKKAKYAEYEKKATFKAMYESGNIASNNIVSNDKISEDVSHYYGKNHGKKYK